MEKLLPKCPICSKPQLQKPTKDWKYGNVQCFRYLCSTCDKSFNYYISSNGKQWTIPKPKV